MDVQRSLIEDKINLIKTEVYKENYLFKQQLEKKKDLIKNIPLIAIIGYTNAGKSKLMNQIIKKNVVESKDILF